ncbi:endo-1,3-alpha-glucanase family glycosylhydrolase [Streptosporangium roseum]|uniref:Carbohydrate-binding module family 96 domain-containing protein n=1 Tax=Streptosporangium roseum (strain ATCC 12428 / DSM 43021 / JCM 3005 / KCTC 9067 / NCIMB 10171 / NRRL 2505 / NI 9100) TaxID=479432 RepID=D2ARQ3_STRRD|nr:endo-1,3-alpha-glucanase family glycosylhydrolase [Streptosporangium roseum]ACZ84582.1 hypothetical protein Sros_1589 [Streptosporangium roseum DSM 43021]
MNLQVKLGKTVALLVGVLVLGMSGPPMAGAATRSAAPAPITLTAVKDTYASQASPTRVHETYTWLSVCAKTCDGKPGAERRALAGFTVAGVPAGARDVTMVLEVTAARTTDTTVSASKVTGSWAPATTTWNSLPQYGPALAEREGLVNGAVAKFDVSAAFTGNGSYSFGFTSASGAQGVLHSSRSTSGKGPRLVVTYTAPAATPAPTATPTPTATPVPKGPLPFDLPTAKTLRASSHKVFAHYFTPYPLSLDNKAASEDYYTRNYLNPAGESGKHAAYGGLLRDRPLPRAPLAGNWQLQDMETEVRTAAAAGIDGFTVDILSLTSQNWTRLKLLIQAAEKVDPGFTIVLMPDMTSLKSDAATLAASLADLAKSESVYRLDDGRLVVSPFKAEAQTPAWWSNLISIMNSEYGIKVAFVPLFLNFSSNASAFAPISYGFSNWGNRSPAQQSGIASNIKLAHSLGKIWMQPVSVQDERPNQGVYDEAGNTENLRTTWERSITGGADWVQLTTWNDFSEGTQFTPSVHNGHAYLDISSYYLTWLKTGKAPPIVRDTVYLTHRSQLAAARPASGTQTKFMTPRPGTGAPRDAVEILSFLTGAATVNASIGGTAENYQGRAGMQVQLYPLAFGTNKVSVVRSGQTTATVTSPFTVKQTVTVQDLQYNAAGSGR